MSINGVILKPNYQQLLRSNELPFEISSDGLEKLKYKTNTPRQNLSIVSDNLEANSSNLKISAQDGYIYLTSKRLIYITSSQGDIESFVIDLTLAPILKLNHKLVSPWFGANYWQFLFFSSKQPSIASDGFPKEQYFKGEIKFLDGGLFEFVEKLNLVLNDVVNNKDIDDALPAYSPT
ncbi:uncharacterized protein KGF55_004866 [Candida pseudojiufengensis]|uniref:uncharacterized protein n=1 Tax=Candida pseudojiufengensis TaxID=497109 RepID=UPI002225A810|nr:uncharacterized protein KGF55_004866 [Candida pseudojiufengensis]KAI5960143.1 hypothetical protein KGF55_004866 [Candida pseudojiufengensis]